LAMGSGGLAAISMIEKSYKDNMTQEEAIAVAADAIRAGQI